MTNEDLLAGDYGTAAPAATAATAATAAKAPDLSALLTELGGDNPRNRVIAEGLNKQGITSVKDIGVQKVPVPGHFEGTDEAARWVPETTTNAYINKATNQPINPERIGIMQNGQYGLKGGDIFFHLNADQNGNVSFDPQWSPRAHGFLRDNAVGQAIMAAGKIIPSPFQPFFAAAGAADALAHGKYGQALASVVPYGINELAQGTDLLTNLRGADFNPVSATSAGNIAEALGVPGQYADIAGKIGSSELSNQLKGGPAGLGALNAAVGSGVQAGIGALGGIGNQISNMFIPGASIGNIPEDELNSLYGSQSPTGPGSVSPDLSLLTPEQLQALYNIENPGGYDPNALSAISDPNVDLTRSDLFGTDTTVGGGGTDTTVGGGGTDTNVTTALNTLTSNQISALTSSPIGSLLTGALTGAIVSNITGGGGGNTSQINAVDTSQVKALDTSQVKTLDTSQVKALDTSQTKTLDTSQVGALTTTDARGLQALPTSDARYWRQTGAQGTGGKGGVRFFDWYDTPENRTMAPATMAPAAIPAITSQQAQAMTTPAPTPTPKQYFNQATNRYYTDTTGNWTPPAGWTQTGLKDGGEVKTNFDKGGDVGGYDWGYDFDSLIPSGSGYTDDGANTLNDLRWASGYFGTPEEIAQNYGNEGNAYTGDNALDATTNSPVNVDSNSSGSVLDRLIKLAKDNPNLTKALAAAGIGGLLGYAGRPKPVAPMGMQAGSLGLTQNQVYNALKGVPVKRAEGGGIDGYAGGGGLHYLKSAEDGMADKIPATIDNKQPAKLSGGEFVIPADVVSHLGNGNSEAGAKQLYDMMDRIRHARTGTKKQGKQINPAKFTPK